MAIEELIRQHLRALLSRPLARHAAVGQVKREPKRSTVPQLYDFLDHLQCFDDRIGLPKRKFVQSFKPPSRDTVPKLSVLYFPFRARTGGSTFPI
jgi:hypothetical protein